MARKTTLRALALWRTICAERSSVSPTAWARGPAEKRSTLALLARRRGRQRRAARLDVLRLARRELASPRLVAHMQPVGRLGRDEAGLAERHRQRAEDDPAGVHDELAVLDRVREAVQAARGRTELLRPWCPGGHSASRGRGIRTSSCGRRSWACSRGAGSAATSCARWWWCPSRPADSPSWKARLGSMSWTNVRACGK